MANDALQWDRCLSNLIIKSSLGLGFGVVFSVLLFKRRAWPTFLGAGGRVTGGQMKGSVSRTSRRLRRILLA